MNAVPGQDGTVPPARLEAEHRLGEARAEELRNLQLGLGRVVALKREWVSEPSGLRRRIVEETELVEDPPGLLQGVVAAQIGIDKDLREGDQGGRPIPLCVGLVDGPQLPSLLERSRWMVGSFLSRPRATA